MIKGGGKMINDKRIIIVEDDPDINNLIAYNLRKDGFNVEQVFDGWSAQERLKNESFDIVILDIMLPGIDGLDLCKLVKANLRNFYTFIMMVSARTHEEDKLSAQLLGADCYLSKPFNLARLLNTVREVSVNLDREFLVKSR
jgi:DNA-binding response OmpR family regulator